jgi:peptidoglycan/xylan/chitin deacetylase (PgdA/CDA1 family)
LGLRLAKPSAVSFLATAAVVAGMVALVALVIDSRVAARERPPAVLLSPDGSRTVYVDFHPRHTRVSWQGTPPVPFFQPADGHPSIALTFDCAWVNEAEGMKILDFLKARDIRATFFISGPFVFADYRRGTAGGLNRANFPLIHRMIEDGHEFGSHTRTHPHNAAWIDWARENDDLRHGWEAVTRELFGEAPPANARMLPFWRAPYGEYDDRALRMASRAGFPLQIGWTVDVHDGLGLPRCGGGDPPGARCIDANRMTDRVIDYVNAQTGRFKGLVVLAHLQNPYDWSGTPDGLPRLVETLARGGIGLRPLSEIFNWDLAPGVRPAGVAGARPASTP